MPAHIFVVDEPNFEICVQHGLAGIFKLDGKQTNELILSHMLLLRKGDPILFYIKGRQELHGVWEVVSDPFYDTTRVWMDRLYPYRVCIHAVTNSVFPIPLKLSDIYLLRDGGAIWNFHLMRNQRSSNAIIEVTDREFDIIYNEYLKINPEGGADYFHIPEHKYTGVDLTEHLSYKHTKRGEVKPQFEFTIMALLARGLSNKNSFGFFCGYNDYIPFVQTDWGKEIDLLLIYEHPYIKGLVTSYDLVEVKKDMFSRDSLAQLLNYESWFVKKRANGDNNMVRSIAIAASFHKDVIAYLNERLYFEKKKTLLFKYKITNEHKLELHRVL